MIRKANKDKSLNLENPLRFKSVTFVQAHVNNLSNTWTLDQIQNSKGAALLLLPAPFSR